MTKAGHLPGLCFARRATAYLRLPVRLGAWVKAEAATDFCAGVDFGLLRILPALLATDGLVCSLRLLMGITSYAV